MCASTGDGCIRNFCAENKRLFSNLFAHWHFGSSGSLKRFKSQDVRPGIPVDDSRSHWKLIQRFNEVDAKEYFEWGSRVEDHSLPQSSTIECRLSNVNQRTLRHCGQRLAYIGIQEPPRAQPVTPATAAESKERIRVDSFSWHLEALLREVPGDRWKCPSITCLTLGKPNGDPSPATTALFS